MASVPEARLEDVPSDPPATVVHASDLELVRRARAGERTAIETFAERMRCIPRVLHARNARSGSPLSADDLDDVAQEAFSVLWRKSGTYEARARLETWATRYALLVYLNAVRRRRAAALEGEPADAERESPSPALRSRLFAALERLERETARVIELRELDRLSFADIAAATAQPLGTVKNRYYRGLEELRRLLEPHREGLL